MSPCEECGGSVSSYSHGCPGCGAPLCCQRCCDEANQEYKAESLSHLLESWWEYQNTAVGDGVEKRLKRSLNKHIEVLEQAASNSFSWDSFQNLGEVAKANDREVVRSIHELKATILGLLGRQNDY
jgi:hypothetical protein